MPSVFISHSSKDSDAASAACTALEKAQIRCWISSRDIAAGDEVWSAEIIQAIDESSVIVLIFSSHANESKQVARELHYASEQGIPIIPVRIENVPLAKALAYLVGTVQWLDAPRPIESHLPLLTSAVANKLGKPRVGRTTT